MMWPITLFIVINFAAARKKHHKSKSQPAAEQPDSGASSSSDSQMFTDPPSSTEMPTAMPTAAQNPVGTVTYTFENSLITEATTLTFYADLGPQSVISPEPFFTSTPTNTPDGTSGGAAPPAAAPPAVIPAAVPPAAAPPAAVPPAAAATANGASSGGGNLAPHNAAVPKGDSATSNRNPYSPNDNPDNSAVPINSPVVPGVPVASPAPYSAVPGVPAIPSGPIPGIPVSPGNSTPSNPVLTRNTVIPTANSVAVTIANPATVATTSSTKFDSEPEYSVRTNGKNFPKGTPVNPSSNANIQSAAQPTMQPAPAPGVVTTSAEDGGANTVGQRGVPQVSPGSAAGSGSRAGVGAGSDGAGAGAGSGVNGGASGAGSGGTSGAGGVNGSDDSDNSDDGEGQSSGPSVSSTSLSPNSAVPVTFSFSSFTPVIPTTTKKKGRFGLNVDQPTPVS